MVGAIAHALLVLRRAEPSVQGLRAERDAYRLVRSVGRLCGRLHHEAVPPFGADASTVALFDATDGARARLFAGLGLFAGEVLRPGGSFARSFSLFVEANVWAFVAAHERGERWADPGALSPVEIARGYRERAEALWRLAPPSIGGAS